MRKFKAVPGEYYHIYNRGNNKQNIFIDKSDWVRFAFLIIYFQSPIVFSNIGYSVSNFNKYQVYGISKKILEKILENRNVELINFTNMPNHFHLTVMEIEENGISSYMQRVQNAYTKYFNTKYKKSGHLFQGPYNIVHVKNNEQLLHLSAYIHRNPREIKQWKNKEDKYSWSSYQDYINENRWGELLKPKIILDQFSNKEEYGNFVNTSGTKLNK